MLVIGLTGGIGSGKTTVANLFSDYGITVIDTDQLAREVTEPGEPALKKILLEFGPHILLDNGSLNRTALRKVIFKDNNKRIWLENLLHPLIRNKIEQKIKLFPSPYYIIVIPLLFETKPNPLINRILVVDTSELEQIKRVKTRDNSDLEEIKAILNAQVNRAFRLASADDVIKNEGGEIELKPQVEKLHKFYMALAKKIQ